MSRATADNLASQQRRAEFLEWKALVAQYEKPNAWRASWQLANTLLPYAGLWWLMYLCLDVSWWLTIPVALLAGAFLIRIFIIFHDCGHGSFFRSQWANNLWGFLCGMVCFTPYYHWRWEHAIHHASAGNLDRRGVGDIWTMTVQEYFASSRWKRLGYRLARHPFVLLLIAPLYLFVIRQRFWSKGAPRRQKLSVLWMNLALLGMVSGMSLLYGVVPYVILQLTVIAVAGAAGIWLFYVQHQFEDAYWEYRDDWDYKAAALQGSSYYKLPRILQWFSGNIGFHHIHHLSARIPNYNLERCHESHPLFRDVKPVTLWSSLKSLTYRLWDESTRKLVSFRRARKSIERQADDAQPADASAAMDDSHDAQRADRSAAPRDSGDETRDKTQMAADS
jgi:omega-6 fatty acid desaturase (delta-12 desaturase)